MKKLLALVIMVFTIFAFTGCTNATDDGSELILDIVNNLTLVERDFTFVEEDFKGATINGTGRTVAVSIDVEAYSILSMYSSKGKLALLTIDFKRNGTVVEVYSITIMYTNLGSEHFMTVDYRAEDEGYKLEDITYKEFIRLLERMTVRAFDAVHYELAD